MRNQLRARGRRAGKRMLAGALGALLIGLLTLASAAGSSGTAPGVAGTDEDEQRQRGHGLEIELTDITPAVLAAEDALTVRGTVTNETGADLESLDLRLRMQGSTPVSRSALEAWLEPTSLSATSLLAVESTTALADGASGNFVLEVPAEELPIRPSAFTWGPRGIEVEATTPTGESASARSFAVWAPEGELEPTRLSVLVPAVPDGAERDEDGGLTPAGAARLGSVIDTLSGTGATLAVDPSATADPGELTAFDGEVIALPWADADEAALAHAGRVDLLERARERTADSGATVTTLAWPVQTDRATAEAAAASGADAVVVPGAALEATQVLTYTPTGRAQVPTSSGDLEALVVDDRLSAMLLGTWLPVNVGPAGEATRVDALTARQLLLADTAVITRERPSDPRGMTLVIPRSEMVDVAPATLAQLLETLGQAPWAELVPVSAVLAMEAPTLAREDLVPQQVADDEVSARTLRTVDDAVRAAAEFATVLEDPETFLAGLEGSLGTAVSAGWRSAPEERERRVSTTASEVAALNDRLVALPSSTLNLINDAARIPVRIANDLDQAARVRVVVEGPDHRLQAQEVVETEVPAGAQSTAHVPVHAVGSGTVQVTARLLSPAGDEVGTPTELTIRVRAGWEDMGTAVVAGILVVLLILGLVRTARRGRRMEPVVEEEE